jgi:hypothetical protein
MPIPEPPPDATYFRVLLLDPQGFGSSELKRLLEDCGLQVLDIEEQSRQEVNVRARKRAS